MPARRLTKTRKDVIAKLDDYSERLQNLQSQADTCNTTSDRNQTEGSDVSQQDKGKPTPLKQTFEKKASSSESPPCTLAALVDEITGGNDTMTAGEIKRSAQEREDTRCAGLDFAAMTNEQLGNHAEQSLAVWIARSPAITELERRIIDWQTRNAEVEVKERAKNEINAAMKKAGVRIQVDGYEGLATLGFHRTNNSFNLTISGERGNKPFVGKTLRLVPTTHNLRRSRPPSEKFDAPEPS